MKTILWISALVAGQALASQEGGAVAPVIRDAMTHEQLAAMLQEAQNEDPMKNLPPSTGEDPSKVNQPESLMSRSDVIAFGGNATMVPKRAILFVPPQLKERMGIRDDVSLLPWEQFYTANRGWITTVEVTRDQAAGRAPLGEEMEKQIGGAGGNVIVATFKGGPISVLPLKTEESAETDRSSSANTVK